MEFDKARFAAGEMPTHTRNGKKILWIADCGLDIGYPISVVFEGMPEAKNYTRDGVYHIGHTSEIDLVHHPKTEGPVGHSRQSIACFMTKILKLWRMFAGRNDR